MTPTPPLRVLYITAGFPFPLSSGYLRHFHLLRELAPDHHLHLMSLVGPRFTPADEEGLAGFVNRVTTFARPTNHRSTDRWARLLDPGRADPAGVKLAGAVEAELEHGNVDVVVLSGKDTSLVADVVCGRVPLVIDLCDATSSRVTQEIELAGPARRAGLTIRRRNLRRVERHLVELGDALLTASSRDRDALLEEGAPPRVSLAQVVPNGIDLAYWQRKSERVGDAVVFCGNLGYRPNSDAARNLVQEIMPLVWAQRPRTKVVVIGRDASPALIRDLSGPGVTLTGSVDDVRPHLELGAVFAAPLRMAAGIQNKLLEALAMELPVVTTSIAAAGLVAGHEQPPLTVADTTAEAAAAILVQLERLDYGLRWPHADGRRWVGDRFQWTASGQTLADIVRATEIRELASC